MEQYDHRLFKLKMMACVSALFHLFVAALDIDLWVEWVNTDANIADLPSRPLSGRGELSEIIPPLVEHPMIFICEENSTTPHSSSKSGRNRHVEHDIWVSQRHM